MSECECKMVTDLRERIAKLEGENRLLRGILNRSYRLQKMHTQALQRHLIALAVPLDMPKMGTDEPAGGEDA